MSSAMRYKLVKGYNWYSKCPKISYTKVADKMANANSADQDQTVCHSAKYFKKHKQTLVKKIRELSARNFRTFTVFALIYGITALVP